MPSKSNPLNQKKKKSQTRGETYCWNQEKMLKTLLKDNKEIFKKGFEEGLPSLVGNITESYETFGGMDHLEGKDLPSKRVVIEVLEDLLTVLC